MKSAFDTCHLARKKNDLKTLKTPACEGYPDKIKDELDKLKKQMVAIQEDIKKPESQPVVVVNGLDNKIYSEFKNDLKALDVAQKEAAHDQNLQAQDYEMLRAQNMVTDASKLTACGDDQAIWASQYQDGMVCSGPEANVININVKFEPQLEAMKKLHRDKLISRINLDSFGETVKAQYYLANPELKARMKLHPDKACLEVTKSESLCTGQYLSVFNLSVAKTNNSGAGQHFLELDQEKVIIELNVLMDDIKQICEGARRHMRVGMYNCQGACEAEKKAMEIKIKEIQAHPAASYFFTDAVGAIINFNKLQPDTGCTGLHLGPNDLHLSKKTLELSRNEFQESVAGQFGTSSDMLKPDRGGHSNERGADQCGVGINEKEDLYALNALYRGHPYMMGKAMKGLNVSEQGLYNTLICEAVQCNKTVHDGNEAFYDGLKVASLALNLIPVAGTIAYGAVTGVINSVGAYRKWDNANQDKKLIGGGIIDGGFKGYSTELNDVMKKLSEDGSTANMMADIMSEVALVVVKGQGAVGKGLIGKMNANFEAQLNRTLTDFEKDIVARISERIVEGTVSKAKLTVKGELELKHMAPTLKDLVIVFAAMKSNTAEKIFRSPKGTDIVTDLADLPPESDQNLNDKDLESFIAKHSLLKLKK
ncbi:MAG: hypothetical protein H0V66_12075 [Bdellovibrionales bacterium]|nr:hypothetical protein [Bdellovibrionales bacterium]